MNKSLTGPSGYILSDLNKKQKEAVEILSGPVLVVAGPGSGKTKTLTHRIAYLISQGIKPYNILAVTFTNKAAEEMRIRVNKLLNPSPNTSLRPSEALREGGNPNIGTFHSICARILRRDGESLGYSPSFTIYDEEDALKSIKGVMRNLSIDQKQFSPTKIRAVISSLKNELIAPDHYQVEENSPFSKELIKVYTKYQKQLMEQNALDFDDLLMKVVELFTNHPKVLSKYQSQFKHILVDEFQDTNLGQYKIANSLAGERGNLYCIGDLDQSIYSFRGADYRNILNFEKDWPGAKIITLEQNYRSTQNVLDAADSIISLNTQRKEKALWTQNGTGDPITIKETEDESDEGEFITSQITRQVREQGLKLKDFVVLYRTNTQSRAIEESFLRNGFPYKIIGGIKFYQRKEIKDILAWLRLCLNSNDAMAMSRIMDIPAKFFKHKQVVGLKAQKINYLIADFSDKCKAVKLTELLEYIIKTAGFEEYLRDGTERGEERWDNVRELLSVSARHDNKEPREAMQTLLEEAALAQEADNVEYEKDLVNLMTLHAVKGLEFPVVFIAGCEQGLLPHSRAIFGANQNELEEERRLCYVGVTRAKKKVYLLFAQRRMIFGRIQSNPPSEFLHDIPEHLIEFIPAESEERVIELD